MASLSTSTSIRSLTRALHHASLSVPSSSSSSSSATPMRLWAKATAYAPPISSSRPRLLSTVASHSSAPCCPTAARLVASSSSAYRVRTISPSASRCASTSSSSSTSPPPSTKDLRAALSASQRRAYTQRNRSLFMYTGAVIIIGIGVTYAAVPLYRAFCSATGFSGTPILATLGEGKFDPSRLIPAWLDPRTGSETRRIRVTFNADSTDALPWSFEPAQKEIYVLPGETALAFYKAKNNGPKDITGIATYNVAPDRVAPYFAKVECFCFEEQKLLAGEEVDLPVFFFIDRDAMEDPSVRDVKDVVLSYTFFGARRNKAGHLEPDTDLEAYRVGIDLPGVK